MILQKDNPILRKKAEKVPISEIITPKIQKVLKEMIDVLHKQPDGVAIAAPQIGYGLRIFIVRGLALRGEHETVAKEIQEKRQKSHRDLVFINPEIIKTSKSRESLTEGCLSVRGKYGEVQRHTKCSVRAYDEYGNVFERGASGLLAQVFQHEIDHLNGILFIDKAKNLQEIRPEGSHS